MQGLKPALEIKGIDVVGDLTPPGEEDSSDDLTSVKRGAFGLGSDSVRAKVELQIVLGKGIEADANGGGGLVDFVQMREWGDYKSKVQTDKSAKVPKRDLKLEALADVLRGKLLVQIRCYRARRISHRKGVTLHPIYHLRSRERDSRNDDQRIGVH